MLFRFLGRKLKYLGNQNSGDQPSEEETTINISKVLERNVEELENKMGKSSDFKIHRMRFGPGNTIEGVLLYIDGLVNSMLVTESILAPLKKWRQKENQTVSGKLLPKLLAEEVICSNEVKLISDLTEATSGFLSGDTVLLINGCEKGLVINTKGYEKRSVTEPQSETVVRGPREGFTENLLTNSSLIRRKVRHEKLHTERLIVGKKTKTGIFIMYLDGVADPKVIKELKYRISKLDVDSILESGYIEEYIEDAPFSPFATVGYTEKPDVVAAKILEGRIAILIDGTPFVLTVPMLLIENFQSTEDYYNRPLYSSIMRSLRYLGFFITVFGPAIYIALTAFHHELIPTTLIFTIAKAREGTPFPVFFEAFIMLFAFEVLREAGIRLPRAVGQAISIVGALIMGDAAVSAGLVGAPIVITIAITAVSSFLVPAQNDSASILRLFLMILASMLGGYGIAMGFLFVLLHLAKLESFGVPYFDGFAWSANLKDSFIRLPMWWMIDRPREIAKGDITRKKFFIPPLRPHGKDQKGAKKT